VKRNQLLIGGAAVLVIVLLWYFLLYKPLGDDLTSAQEQTSAEQKKTDGLEADLARLQSQAKNASKQQALLRKLDAAVPKNPDLAEFIIQANDIAESSGISFLSIAPTPPAAGDGASVINMTISISGSFFQLQDYLRQLEQLERLVIVDGISISSGGGGSSGASGSSSDTSSSSTGDTSLSVSLTARMFTRAAPTTSADGSTGTGGSTTTTTVPGGSTSSTTATTAAPNPSGGT
jgi:type IV pilus assembly protein PilO